MKCTKTIKFYIKLCKGGDYIKLLTAKIRRFNIFYCLKLINRMKFYNKRNKEPFNFVLKFVKGPIKQKLFTSTLV